MNTEPFTAERWRDTIADLNARLATALSRATALDEERRPATLAAAIGDEAAKARLADLNRDAGAVACEIEDLELALEEANARLREAERHEADVAHQAAFAELDRLLTEREARARKVDEAFAALVEPLQALHALSDEVLQRLAALRPDIERWDGLGSPLRPLALRAYLSHALFRCVGEMVALDSSIPRPKRLQPIAEHLAETHEALRRTGRERPAAAPAGHG